MTINHFPRRTFIKSSLAFTLAALLPLKKFSKQISIAPNPERTELERLLKIYGPEMGPMPHRAGRKNHGHI